jgi:hypothetical protein
LNLHTTTFNLSSAIPAIEPQTWSRPIDLSTPSPRNPFLLFLLSRNPLDHHLHLPISAKFSLVLAHNRISNPVKTKPGRERRPPLRHSRIHPRRPRERSRRSPVQHVERGYGWISWENTFVLLVLNGMVIATGRQEAVVSKRESIDKRLGIRLNTLAITEQEEDRMRIKLA